MSTFNYSQTPQSVRQLFSNSFALYKLSLGKVWIWQLLFGIVICAVPIFWLNDPTVNTTVKLIAGLVSLIISQLTALLLMTLMNNIATQRDLPLSASFSIAGKRIWLSVVGILIIIVGFAIAAFIIAFCLALMASLLSTNKDTILFITILPVFIICIYFMIRFMFYTPAILLDNTGIFVSLKTSFQLVRSHWWRVFWVFLLVTLLTAAIPQLLSHILTAGNKMAAAIVYWLLTSVTIPFSLSTILVMFYDLKLRKSNG